MKGWSIKQDKCVHCKKAKGQHHAQSFACPVGSKTRIGYIHYSKKTRWEPKERK